MEEVGLPVLAVEGLGDDVAGKAEVGLAVLAAVDVAVQVRQEQPPHRRPPLSLSPPTNPIPLGSSTIPAADGSDRDRGALKSEVGSEARGAGEVFIAAGLCARQRRRCLLAATATEWGN